VPRIPSVPPLPGLPDPLRRVHLPRDLVQGLLGGADVWEVVRAVRATRAHEPHLSEDDLLNLVCENSGLSIRQIRTALHYWAAYPDGIEAEIAAADEAETAAERAWQREQALFSR